MKQKHTMYAGASRSSRWLPIAAALAMISCGKSEPTGTTPPKLTIDALVADPQRDYQGTPFSVVSRVAIGGLLGDFTALGVDDLIFRDGTLYGVTRLKTAVGTNGSRCLQALNTTVVRTCAGSETIDSPTAGATNRFLLDPQTNGAAFFVTITPPNLGGADTQTRFQITPMVTGWAAPTYAGLQSPKVALVASALFVVMDLQAGSAGSTPYMSVLNYGAVFNRTGVSFPTPQPINVELFGRPTPGNTNYPIVMNHDFAVHDGRNGLYAFLSRADSKTPVTGGTSAGAVQLWQHNGTTLTSMATRSVTSTAAAAPSGDGWFANGVRLVRNAAQPTRPYLVVDNVSTGLLDVYAYDGTTTLQQVATGITKPANFTFAQAPMVAVGSTLYFAASRQIYKLASGAVTPVFGGFFNQGSSSSKPLTPIDVLASDGTSLYIGVGREFVGYNYTVADVLKAALP